MKQRTLPRRPAERPPHPASFARKFRVLLERFPRPDGEPYTVGEIAEGTRLSPTYVLMLRSGKRKNPTMETLRRLADFFGVPVALFYEELPPKTLRGLAATKDIVRQLMQAEVNLAEGRFEKVTRLLKEVPRQLHPLMPAELHIRTWRVLGRALRGLGQTEEARATLRRALTHVTPDPLESAETLLELGKLEYDRQRFQEAYAHYTDALRTISDAPVGKSARRTLSLKLQALHGLGVIHRRLGRPETAIEQFARALGLVEQIGDTVRRAHLYMGLSLAQMDLKRGGAALDALSHALETYRTLDDMKLVADAQHNMALTLLTMRRYAEAKALLEQSKTGHQSANDEFGIANDYMALGRHAYAVNDLGQARAWTNRSLDMFVTLNLPAQIGECLLLRAQIAVRQDDRDDARRTFDDAIKVFEQHQLSSNVAHALRVYGECRDAWGEQQEANALYRRALELFSNLAMS